MEVEAAVQQLEAACALLQSAPPPHSEAEASLLSFRSQPSSTVLPVTRHVLQHSSSPLVCFHAVCGLQEAALRDWPTLSLPDQLSLQSFCMSCVVASSSSSSSSSSSRGFVREKLISTLALFVKRSWQDTNESQKEQLFSYLASLVSSGNASEKRTALAILEALVTEFNPASASLIRGVPLDFNDSCRASFERLLLLELFSMAFSSAQSAAASAFDLSSNSPAAGAAAAAGGGGGGEGAAAGGGGEGYGAVLLSAVRLMAAILQWDFKPVAVSAADRRRLQRSGRGGGSSVQHNDVTLIRPGKAWHEALLSPSLSLFLTEAYMRVRAITGQLAGVCGGHDSLLGVSLRHVIISLCSLSGDVFCPPHATSANGGSAAGGGGGAGGRGVGGGGGGASTGNDCEVASFRSSHVLRLLSSLSRLITPLPSAIEAIRTQQASNGELLDCARCLAALVSIHTDCFSMQQAGDVSGLWLLAEVTGGLAEMAVEEEEGRGEGWGVEEVFDVLLEAWQPLLQWADDVKNHSHRLGSSSPSLPPSMAPPLSSDLASCSAIGTAAAVFEKLMAAYLKAAEKSAEDEESEEDSMRAAIEAREERLSMVAGVGRLAAHSSLPLLTHMLQQQKAALLQQLSSGSAAIVLKEQLHFCIRLAAAIVADEGVGETPQVPPSIASAASSSSSDHPALLLFRSVYDVACMISSDSPLHMAALSPRLTEALLWFVSRWLRTYLLPQPSDWAVCAPLEDEKRRPFVAMGLVLGPEGEGMGLLSAVVGMALAGMMKWRGEPDVQAAVCVTLLSALTSSPSTAKCLQQVPQWQQLASALVSRDPAVRSLPHSHQRSLASAVARAATATSSQQDDIRRSMHALCSPAAASLSAITLLPNIQSIRYQHDVISEVCGLLESFRGLCRGCHTAAIPVIFAVGMDFMEACLRLLVLYQHEPLVVYLILKAACQWVDATVVFCTPAETNALFSLCLRLLQTYSSHNINRVSLDSSRSLAEEAAFERSRGIRALLQLLNNLTSKDLVDFSPAPSPQASAESAAPDVAQVIYLGLSIVTPLISPQLLQFPKLCRSYFVLLEHIFGIHPEKVALLSSVSLSPLLQTLEFGLRHEDAENVRSCCRSLESVALFSAQQQQQQQQDSSSLLQTPLFKGLHHLTLLLLRMLLVQEFRQDQLQDAATALLPMLICHPSSLQDVYSELCSHLSAFPHHQQQLSAAISALRLPQITSLKFSRNDRRGFLASVNEMVAKARSVPLVASP